MDCPTKNVKSSDRDAVRRALEQAGPNGRRQLKAALVPAQEAPPSRGAAALHVKPVCSQ